MFRVFLFFFLITNVFATQRIITLSPSINEIVYALGSGDEVVGNTQYCKYPKESIDVPKVGGYFSPSLEKILSLNPSLVIMQKNNYQLSKKLNKLGIKTKVLSIDSLANIKNSIIEIGEVLNAKQKAREIVKDIDKELQNIKGIIKDKKILIVIGHNTSLASRVFVAGQNLYFDEIIKASGNTNAFQSTRRGQPILNMENIIATNADIVILLAHSMDELKLTKKSLTDPWLKLPINAAKTKSIYIMDKDYAGIPSDRLVLFLRDFRAVLANVKNR
jgi:iron complex transport system substrate-binding protein